MPRESATRPIPGGVMLVTHPPVGCCRWILPSVLAGCQADRAGPAGLSGERQGPPAAKGLATFGMAFLLAAGSAIFDRNPMISRRAPAKPRIHRDRTELP